jgi:hypothetical protein
VGTLPIFACAMPADYVAEEACFGSMTAPMLDAHVLNSGMTDVDVTNAHRQVDGVSCGVNSCPKA